MSRRHATTDLRRGAPRLRRRRPGTRLAGLLVLVLMVPSLLLSQGGAIDLCRCAGLVDALRIAAGAPCCCGELEPGPPDRGADDAPVVQSASCPGCGSVVFEPIDLGFEGSSPAEAHVPPAPRFVLDVLPEPTVPAAVRPSAWERGPPNGAVSPPGLLPGTRPLRI